jgi:NADPH:quinone reductase-like Zn-dependent oxidoreductase
MKAVHIEALRGLDGIDGLSYGDVPDPQPSIGDALVEVRAASFTPTELTWPLWIDRNGHRRESIIPAHEGAGVVVGLGYGAAGVSVGDEVFGLIDGYRDGWAAEHVTIETRSLAAKPASLDFVQAAAVPQAGLTSWQALFDHGHLESGHTVLILGAAGGVGSIGVPLARWSGARVIGGGRERAQEHLLALGAEFVDVDRDAWELDLEPVDLVYDIIGGDVATRAASTLAPGGALVSVMNPPVTDRDDIRTVHFIRDANGAQLEQIAKLVDDGVVTTGVDAVYPFAGALAIVWVTGLQFTDVTGVDCR